MYQTDSYVLHEPGSITDYDLFPGTRGIFIGIINHSCICQIIHINNVIKTFLQSRIWIYMYIYYQDSWYSSDAKIKLIFAINYVTDFGGQTQFLFLLELKEALHPNSKRKCIFVCPPKSHIIVHYLYNI
jgi:hypothetical protein